MWVVTREGPGDLPRELKGKWTSEGRALKAIDMYRRRTFPELYATS